MSKRIVEGIEVEASSGNVFADLDLPEADKLQIKSGLTQPKVSSLLRGEFSNFSERKLMNCLNRLGYDIEIRIRKTPKPVGQLTLTHA